LQQTHESSETRLISITIKKQNTTRLVRLDSEAIDGGGDGGLVSTLTSYRE